MTNEELEHAARLFLTHPQFSTLALEVVSGGTERAVVALSEVMRAVAVGAYEEAAQIAIDHREGSLEGCGEGGCGNTIASEIRALKDSLVGEGV